MRKQLPERFEPAGRCSDADHGERIVPIGQGVPTFNALS
jgi:hypothetical protein